MRDHDFVVVDTETTGVLRNSDRIVELAIVRVSKTGKTLSEFTTLINPKRDVGPTSIHGITAEQVSHAPSFHEIAGDVLHHLSGAIFVGHNVFFDLGMLRSEFGRINYELPSLPVACTMRLARHYGVEARKLYQCCDHFKIPLSGAHQAINDARATTDLLRKYMERDRDTLYDGITGSMPRLDSPFRKSGLVCTRGNAASRRNEIPSYLTTLVNKLPNWGSDETAVYLDVLERALEDRRITEGEAKELEQVAIDLKLSAEAVVGVHKRYLSDLINVAFADGVISDTEFADLQRVANVFGMAQVELDSAIRSVISSPRPDSEAPADSETNDLRGKVVCFTGELQTKLDGVPITRERAMQLASEKGLEATSSLTKKVDILVVADGYSMSGKAETARKYGTRIMADTVFWRTIGVKTGHTEDASHPSLLSEPSVIPEPTAPPAAALSLYEEPKVMPEPATEAQDAAAPTGIERRLRKWQRDLINLGLRNKLLNFKPSRILRSKSLGSQIVVEEVEDSDTGTISAVASKRPSASNVAIIDELPEQIFQMLQVDGKTMKFLPLKAEISALADNQKIREGAKTGSLDKKYTDSFLQTNLDDARLGPTLLKIYQKASTLLEEQGINCLFLSFGLLEWYEDKNSEKLLKAPIVLLPVELTRRAASMDFSLKTTQEDPVLNPALVEKLRLDFGIKAPDFPDNFEDFRAHSFLESIQQLVQPQSRWRVTEDIFLDIFSFAKYPMFKELESAFDVYAANPKINELCFGAETTNYAFIQSDVDLDSEFRPEDRFHILEADSSQQRAIFAATKGKDLVIEGPPGTGKSQTIANIIADFLADGKTVLFVSEKMAALNVVFDRLATCGLRDFCFKLHSQEATKRAVYSELGRTLSLPDPIPKKTTNIGPKLAPARQHLNEFVKELHRPFGGRELTPFRVLGRLEHLRDCPKFSNAFPGTHEWSEEEFEQLRSIATDVAVLYGEVGNPAKHPWYGSELAEHDLEVHYRLESLLSAAMQAHQTLATSGARLSTELGVSIPAQIGDFEVLAQGYETLSASPGTSQAILMNEDWNQMPASAAKLLEEGKSYVSNRETFLAMFDAQMFNEDVSELATSFKQCALSWTRTFRPNYWKMVKHLKQRVVVQPSDITRTRLLEALESGAAARRQMDYLESQQRVGQELFGSRWKGIDSDWADLSRFAMWMVSVRKLIVSDVLQERGLELAASGACRNATLKVEVEAARDLARKLSEMLLEVVSVGKFIDAQKDIASASSSLRKAEIWLTRLLNSLPDLNTWCQFTSQVQRSKQTKLFAFIAEFIEQGYAPKDLVDCFEATYLRAWLNETLKQASQLREFNSQRHEHRISEFRLLDSGLRQEAQHGLLSRLFAKRHQQLSKSELSEEISVLQRELRKKTRQLPVRKLMEKAPNVLKGIKPCFMMSPLSVAQYLSPSKHRFDVVIFDEASQIAPEDAVGSIVRGEQVIVVGDPNQLPPTNFFNQQANQSNTEESEDGLEDSVESILDEFASRGFPYAKLLWHYRSKHESLIAFSNKNFYGNQLFTFPSAVADTRTSGLQFEFVDGLYEGAGANSIEAARVADAVVEHIRSTPHLSLGVGTFNINQQKLILDEVEKRRNADDSIEFFFENKGEDRFFVKNLENIQGDDRDVIFISVGFGPERRGEKPRFNFGAVSQKNGWRRLNVLFTRAKHKMRVFSSMRGDQIDSTKALSDGARFLREFLVFAEKGVLQQPSVNVHAEMESDFEIAVFNELTKHGVQLVPQVGQSGYRIDFGVLDPNRPGRFLCGIECDGAQYHSSMTARDRDRLRQQVLEDLGWRLIRIWSLDWFQNKSHQVERILRFVDECKGLPGADDVAIIVEREVPDVVPPAALETASEVRIRREPCPYVFHSFDRTFGADTFDSATQYQIAEAIESVARMEAPISLDDAIRRVLQQWQITKMGSRNSKRITQVIMQLHERCVVELRNDFIYLPGAAIALRSREGLTEPICPEEYEIAVLYALYNSGELLRDEIVLDGARLLGFKRAGVKQKEQILLAVDRLVSTGAITQGARGFRLQSGIIV